MAALAVVVAVAVAVVSVAVGAGAGAGTAADADADADAAGGTFSDMMICVNVTIFDAECVRSSVGWEVQRLMKTNSAKGE